MFERMDIYESIYEGVVETYYKKLLGQTPTVLVTSGKRQEKTPSHRITPRRVRALASTEKDMQIERRANRKYVLSTALGIIMMNARSWETQVISKIKVSLLRNAGIIPYQGTFNSKQENNSIVNNVVDEILLHQTKKVSSAKEAP